MSWKMEKGCRHMVGLSQAVGVIDPSDNWGMHIKVSMVYVNVGQLSLVLQCRKTIPPHPFLHLSTWRRQTSITVVWHCRDPTARLRLLIGCKRHSSIKHLCLWIPTLWRLGGLLQARRQSKSEKIGHNFMQHLSSDAEILSKTAVWKS